MSVLFGFLGPPCPELQRHLTSSLTHRGEVLSVVQHSWGTLGIRHHAADQSATRILREDISSVCALTGHVTTNPVPPSFDLRAPNWRGAWVGARIDPDQLTLARDAAGARSIYWGIVGGRVVFGSEPKVIARAPGFSRKLRVAALAQYLAFSFVPTNETMIEGIYAVGPGEVLVFDGPSAPKVTRWFRAEERTADKYRSDEEWVEHFRAAHADAVRERLRASSPLAFLSGGVDSSAVVAEMHAQGVEPLKTFTIHFGAEYPNELKFAREVATRCGTEHQEVCITPADFVPRLEKAIWHLDDPIGDPVTIPNFELARQVSTSGSHVFNGEGGDPLFGGPKNLTMMMHHIYGVPRTEGFRERRYLESYRRAYQEIPFLLSEDVLAQVDQRRDLEAVLTPFFDTERPKSFLNKLLTINTRLKGAHLILPKVERMLGAWGLAPMSPLFDERMLKLSMTMPEHMKLHGAVEKVALKRAYENELPSSVVERPKSGMRVPVHYWFQGEMRELAEDMLNERAVREVGLFRPERVRQFLDYDVEEGPGRYGLRLWMLLTFELWRRSVLT